MRKMVYIVVAFTGLVVAAMVFSSCTFGAEKYAPSELTGLSMSQNHMNFGYCYSFYLREEDGKVLFDAEVRFEEEPYCIILESCEVDTQCMNDLRNLDKEYSIGDYVTKYKEKPSLFTASDETVNKTTVYLSDGTDVTAHTKDEHIDVLYNFCFSLAQRYINESVYVYEER